MLWRPLEGKYGDPKPLDRGFSSYIDSAFDSRPHLRFRRPHPRNRGAHLPIVDGGLRVAWGGAPLRAVGEDGGLVKPGVPSPALPGTATWLRSAEGRPRPPDRAACPARAGRAPPARCGGPREGGAPFGDQGRGRLELIARLGERPSRAAWHLRSLRLLALP